MDGMTTDHGKKSFSRTLGALIIVINLLAGIWLVMFGEGITSFPDIPLGWSGLVGALYFTNYMPKIATAVTEAKKGAGNV